MLERLAHLERPPFTHPVEQVAKEFEDLHYANSSNANLILLNSLSKRSKEFAMSELVTRADLDTAVEIILSGRNLGLTDEQKRLVLFSAAERKLTRIKIAIAEGELGFHKFSSSSLHTVEDRIIKGMEELQAKLLEREALSSQPESHLPSLRR